jgi:hypothetical protein
LITNLGALAMRLFTIVPATFIPVMVALTGHAAAQNWQNYSYPDYSFGVSFPADPQIETTTYQIADDRTVEARVYAVRRKDAELKVTVAQLDDPTPEETAAIDHAIKTLSAGGEVKVNIPHRVNRVFGRQLSILQGDGSRAAVALFDYDGRFYQIEGKSTGNDAAAEAIRFVQSLTFIGGGSNRSGDDIRAAREACSSVRLGGTSSSAASSGASIPLDGARRELRCRRQQAFAALVSALNSSDLGGAQNAYTSLSEIQGRRSDNPNAPFAQAVSEIGQALRSGDLSRAQQALSSLPRGRGAIREP